MKAESHHKITKWALELYGNAQPRGKLARALGDKRVFDASCKGSMDEDNVGVSRALNWHFFPANATLANGDISLVPFLFPQVKLRPTSLFWIMKRQYDFWKLLQVGASGHIFSTFGRILHHIQDMSTPSHVVPVYHGPSREDPFERYLTTTAPINRWAAIEKRMRGMQTYFETVLSERPAADFVSLYSAAAQRVLRELNASDTLFPVGVNNDFPAIAASSDSFWIPYDGHDKERAPFGIKGFGTFGDLGKNFGARVSLHVQGQEVPVMLQIFEDIAAHYIQAAIADSLRACKVFEQHLQ